ncbi:MAG TPA: Gfo/Idh/MocA family oxidoreductase [Candidatus Limnocylindrales bacterium]|nr:Gfo/Idh/MocA family oxidoreductase [Candidatus Limnocylindrales bacterium]
MGITFGTTPGRVKLCDIAGWKPSLRRSATSFLLLFFAAQFTAASAEKDAVHFALVGLSHDHAGGFIPRAQGRKDILLAGIVESKPELIDRYAKRFHLNSELFFPSLEELLRHTNIQAVAIFTSTFEHRRVVEDCARLGIQVVMMEKPLAVNLEHARLMEAAVKKGKMQLIVNYETTWYPGNQAAYNLVRQGTLGDLRKIVVHDGHRGPKEIGCSQDFLEWLTDPVLNGGGALTDFGCYGADLITWLMDGKRPTSVFAVTGHFKPDVYPKVEDEATIVVTYPKAQGIIQASWNWPFDRKDIEIYGQQGYVLVPRPDVLRVRKPTTQETESSAPKLSDPINDPLSYLGAVVRHEIEPSGLSSLPVNLVVTQILDAARESARTGKRATLK